jgi:aryl-alcohol dehydrogenase-like predicted oxidoreductase
MTTATTDGVALEFRIGGDLKVHRIGFGAMRILGPGVWGPPHDRGECLATLRRLVDLDVNLIDTAESYGPHISESLIAEALYPYPPHLVIATKGGFNRSGPDQWQIDCRPERLREELEGSLRRLRVDRIDLYQLHRIDPAVPEHDQFGFLQQAQREGKIRHVGLSEAGIEQIERAQQFFTVASVQNQYNLADRGWDAVVDFCDRHGIAFMPWAPLQGARPSRTLVGHYARVARNLLKKESALARIARDHGATSVQIALAWLLRRAKVMIPIPGTSTRTHLEENAAASRITLSDEEFSSLSAAFNSPAAASFPRS